MMVMFMSLQPFFSYMGDCYEFMTAGTNGFWGSSDRAWAIMGLATSVQFVLNNEWEWWGPILFVTLLILGMAFWFAGVVLLRIECNCPKLWALCHILWHVLPASGGVSLALSLKPLLWA